MICRFVVTLGLASLALHGCAQAPQSRVESAESLSPQKREARDFVVRARALAAAGDTTRAEQYLNTALDLGGDEREIVPLLLEVCVRDGRFRSAASYAENFLRKHPKDYRMRFILATVYSGLEDIERARKQFEFLLRDRPEHAQAHYALAVLLRDSVGDFSGADHHFREYLRVEPRGAHSEEASASLLNRIP